MSNAVQNSFVGHRGNVKYIAIGSSGVIIEIWDTDAAGCLTTFSGHTSRVWDTCVDQAGSTLMSASGDLGYPCSA